MLWGMRMNRLIAVVEDNAREYETLQSHVSRMSAETETDIQIKWFRTGEEFLAGYQSVYDVVLMDINLANLNGMDVAKCLRKIDEKVVLIFVTSLAQYAVNGYEVNALDFMVKPVNYQTFYDKLTRAFTTCMNQQDRELVLNISDGMYRTSASRIKYVEISSHSLVFHTTEGVLNAYGSLKQMEEQLDPRQFVRCNRSYLVNLAFVRAIHGSDVIVDDEPLQISRPKRNGFLQALNDYLGGGD